MQLTSLSLALTRAGFRSLAAFSPAELFASGEPGAWYDPSDFDRYTSPLGPELVTNGDFSGGTTGWTLQLYGGATGFTFGVSSGAGTLSRSAGSAGYAVVFQTVATVVGKSYQVSGSITSKSGGTLATLFRKYDSVSPESNIVTFLSDVGSVSTGFFTATSTSTLIGFQLNGGAGAAISFDNISVRELTAIDTATLFQDAAGTTPVTAVEQPVGLMLDKSKGLVAGTKGGSLPGIAGSYFTAPDSVANSVTGDIDIRVNARLSSWATAQTLVGKRSSAASNYSYSFRVNSGGAISIEYGTSSTTVASAASTAAVSFSAGALGWVRVIRASSSGEVKFFTSSDGALWTQLGAAVSTSAGAINDGSANIGVGGYPIAGEGQVTGKIFRAQVLSGIDGTVVADFNPTLYTGGSTFTAATGEVWAINGSANITPDGNHAFQTTSASRPVLSARVNLLTKTEQFDDAVWTNAAGVVNVTANTTNAPDGTLSADKLVPAATTSWFGRRQILSFAASSYTQSVFAKEGDSGVHLELFFGAGLTGGAVFNLSTGSVLVSANCTASVGDLDSYGFRRYAITFTLSASAVGQVDVRLTTASTRDTQMVGDNSKGFFAWGADLRVSNDGVGLPAYQRVNTATDYDSGPLWPRFLRFDGVDDWLQTNTITPGTDKAQVFAGVRKLSDAAVGMLVEYSSSIINPGTFYVAAPEDTTTNRYSAASHGAVGVAPSMASFVTGVGSAPDTAVLSALLSISGDSTIIRRNSVAFPAGAGDQGSGNYSNQSMFIGRRGGTTLPFNGRLYPLIVRFGPTLTEAQIASTEGWVAGKTGVRLPVATFDFIVTDAGDQIVTDAGDTVITDTYFV